MNEAGFLRVNQILRDYLPMSKTTFYQKIREGVFPAPKKFGKISFWERGAILRVVQEIGGEKDEAPSAGTLKASKNPARKSATKHEN